MDRKEIADYRICCEVRNDSAEPVYVDAQEKKIDFRITELLQNEIKTVYKVTLINRAEEDFHGVVHIKLVRRCDNPKFFLPGYMYNRNTAEKPSSGRKAFPRIKENPEKMPESSYFMTRSDRLAEPVSLLYDSGKVLGISGEPYRRNKENVDFCGFSCSMEENGEASVGYTLGYENAPWLFVQTATVLERAFLAEENKITIPKAGTCCVQIAVYEYSGEDERAIHKALEDAYWKYHESPRTILNMTPEKAVKMLAAAVRDEAWLDSEEHYYSAFVRREECYGGPLDTDKAVESESVLGYIRAVRLLHQITGEEYLLNHMRDALLYEFSFKLGYNTPVMVPPLKQIGWSSCGGSITSTANPHIHPMSSSVIGEMNYYLKYRHDQYIRSRLEDTIGWSLQTFNTYDGEYGYGKEGWMSERFCFCEGLLTERYPDGTIAGTWFALMPWASASIIEGLVTLL